MRHLDKMYAVRSQDPMGKCFYNLNMCLSTLMVKKTTRVRFQREQSGRWATVPRAVSNITLLSRVQREANINHGSRFSFHLLSLPEAVTLTTFSSES